MNAPISIADRVASLTEPFNAGPAFALMLERPETQQYGNH